MVLDSTRTCIFQTAAKEVPTHFKSSDVIKFRLSFSNVNLSSCDMVWVLCFKCYTFVSWNVGTPEVSQIMITENENVQENMNLTTGVEELEVLPQKEKVSFSFLPS